MAFEWLIFDSFEHLEKAQPHRVPVWAAIKEKYRAWYEREVLRNAIESLSIGASSQSQRSTLANANSSVGELRRKMMATLGLDHAAAARAWPGIMHAVGRACVTCKEPERCRHWLDSGAADDGYRAFCPNARQFAALKKLQDRRESLRLSH